MLEGRLVSAAQIAERPGVSMTTAYDRARRGPFPLTWAGLNEPSTPRTWRGEEQTTMTDMPPTRQRLLRLPEVLERVGLSKSTLYARIRNGTFPKPVHLGTISAWVEREISEWIEDQVLLRNAAA